MIRYQNIRDSGVSPVVGVMLILVIMIVLVGVFAMTATSIFSPTDKPIDADIQYVDMTTDGESYIFEMMNGEPFSKKKLKVVLQSRENPMESITYSDNAISTAYAESVMAGDRLTVNKPDFATAGKYIRWMFYDISTGNLIASGELRSS